MSHLEQTLSALRRATYDLQPGQGDLLRSAIDHAQAEVSSLRDEVARLREALTFTATALANTVEDGRELLVTTTVSREAATFYRDRLDNADVTLGEARAALAAPDAGEGR